MKAMLYLAGLAGLLMGIGYFLFGVTGLLLALGISIIIDGITYFMSDRIVLAMYGAKESDDPYLNEIVAEVARLAGIPKPKVYIINEESPNAFATGRDPEHSAIAVTTGLLKLLSREELKGVIAHEVAHIKNRDILISTIAAVMASAVGIIIDILRWQIFLGEERDHLPASIVIATLVPLLAIILQMAVSREREYLADETGAKTIKNPLALASALEKIATNAEAFGFSATQHMFIHNPFSGDTLFELFSTHPPVEKRIERLKKMVIVH